MNKNIFIVEDNGEVLDAFSEAVPLFGGNPLAFEGSSRAINYLENLEEKDFPLAYFVDMKLIGDLEGSEKLYNYVKSKGVNLDNFYFMTGNLSEHDEEVLDRTEAKYFIKRFSGPHGFLSKIEKILK